MILNGHDVEESLARLAEVEASFRDLAGSREGEAVFRVSGRWLVEEGYLRGLLRSSLARFLRTSPRVPIVGDLSAAALALAAISGPRIRGRNTAVAVCFKSNIRAFYLGARAVTLKLANPTTEGRGLRAEIEIRERLGKTAGVVLPRVIASDGEGSRPCLWEEIVFGRRLDPKRDGALFRCHVLPRILDFYEGRGVRYVIGADFLDLQRLVGDVLEAVDQVPWSAEWMDRELFRARVANCGEESGKHLLVGTGHGDLSCGNILITEDKRVCLLDWSRSREQILMQDLEKLFQQYPGSWTLAVDRMGSWRPEGIDPDRIMSCSRQAMLGNLQLIQSFSEIRQEIAALDTEWNQQIVQQCDRSLVKEFAAATRLMMDGRLKPHLSLGCSRGAASPSFWGKRSGSVTVGRRTTERPGHQSE